MVTSNCVILFVIFVSLVLCFYSFLNVVSDYVSRKRIAVAVGSVSQSSKAQKAISVASKIFDRASARLLKLSFISKGAENIVVLVAMKGFAIGSCQVVSCILCCACVVSLLALLITMSPVFGLALGLCVVVGTIAFSSSRLARATNEMREQVPDAIQCMANCSASGFSLMQTFEQAEKECAGPLGKTFALAHRRMKLGSSIDEALEVLIM